MHYAFHEQVVNAHENLALLGTFPDHVFARALLDERSHQHVEYRRFAFGITAFDERSAWGDIHRKGAETANVCRFDSCDHRRISGASN
jgi:hypothetical protein